MADQVDYAALAEQARKSEAAGVDYSALAFQARGSGEGESFGDYAKETARNVLPSAGRLLSNMGTAIAHPVDTAMNVGKVITGGMQRGMRALGAPAPIEESLTGKSTTPEYDAAKAGLKARYGSIDALANTIKTDPVGVASDASLVLGGASGLARGASSAARMANLPRVAGVASDVARGTALASDIANPLTVPMRMAATPAKWAGRGMAKIALGLPGRAERFGATPAVAALEQTSGVTPTAVRNSARGRLNELDTQLGQLTNDAEAAGNMADLTPARDVVGNKITEVRAGNGMANDLTPMQDQLTLARPGFQGDTDPTGQFATALQRPTVFRRMKGQFGDDFTQFDSAMPQRRNALALGNQAYHELSSEFNRAVPGAAPVNQNIQSLVPVERNAGRMAESPDPLARVMDRATRHTGGMAVPLMAGSVGGVPAAIAAMTVQEVLSSPTARMALARSLYGTGKAVGSPIARRSGIALGGAGKLQNDVDAWRSGQ